MVKISQNVKDIIVDLRVKGELDEAKWKRVRWRIIKTKAIVYGLVGIMFVGCVREPSFWEVFFVFALSYYWIRILLVRQMKCYYMTIYLINYGEKQIALVEGVKTHYTIGPAFIELSVSIKIRGKLEKIKINVLAMLLPWALYSLSGDNVEVFVASTYPHAACFSNKYIYELFYLKST